MAENEEVFQTDEDFPQKDDVQDLVPHKKPGRPKGSKSGYTVSEAVLEARKNHDSTAFLEASKKARQEMTERNRGCSNADYTRFVYAVTMLGKEADRNDIESLRNNFQTYVQMCVENNMRISNLQAYASIGIDRKTASTWLYGTNPERRELIEEIKSICSQYRETLMLSNEINPVVGIWWQKNYDGFTDQPQAEIDANHELGDQIATERIKEKYKDIIVDD